VSPVDLVLRVVAVARPAPTRRVRPALGRAVASVRSAPVAWGYLAVLAATTAVVQASSRRDADRFLLERSTNLHQLSRDPVRVLVASAFWVENVTAFLAAAALVAFVLAPVERRVGGLRTTGIFALGHVGATLVTAAGLWAAIHTDLVERSVAQARDVGASYGCLAVSGALTYLLPRRFRLGYGAALVGVVVVAALISDDFTSVGHVLAVLIGLACFRLVRRREPDG
jgi:hypothetical protein